MDVHAVAGLRRVEQRHEARAHPLRRATSRTTSLRTTLRSALANALGGGHRDLELVRGVLGEEALGLHAGFHERAHHDRWETAPRAAVRRA